MSSKSYSVNEWEWQFGLPMVLEKPSELPPYCSILLKCAPHLSSESRRENP